ncbi:MAG: PEGA domain-containing protein [Bacillota bacterium]|jgi:hypothetical protein|nr:PEGA domain-containing protein [Candidatus Fermentithermobacillaceae bacterium]
MAKRMTEGAVASSGATKGRRRATPVAALVLVAVLAVLTFYLGAQYYTARRSTTFTAMATAMDEEGISFYRLPSGVLDEFAPADPDSPFVKIPLAPRYSVRDSDGKGMKQGAFYVAEGSERAVEVTVNPQGKVCRIRELGGFFSIEGAATVKSTREMEVGGKTLFTDDALFMDGGALTAESGEELEGLVETGDTLKVLGYLDQALVVDVVGRAGRLTVTSNIQGSRVYVDGLLRGKTPLTVSCAPGMRDVLIKADGYRDHRGSVRVASFEETLYEATLEEITGTLSLTSTPSGAAVYVDNQIRGETPLKIQVTPGRHEVTFELEGYYSKSSEVIVPRDHEQAVNAVLARMTGSLPGTGGAGAGPEAREVTVVGASPEAMTFQGMYPAGYTDTFRATASTTMDGWPVTRSTLERLLPGEEVRVVLAPDGSVASMSKTRSHGFSMKDRVQTKNGPSIFLGERWVECTLAWNAVLQDAHGNRWFKDISPGDTVTVYGASAADIRFVRVEETLGETTQIEGHLVPTPQGFRVFGDSYIMGILIPDGLRVADVHTRATVSVSEVPSGSRVRFFLSPTQETVWAEVVWRANVSAEGPISVLNGNLLRVAPLWDDLSMDLWTVIYHGSSKTTYHNLSIGDTVLAAGPSAGDIRFIWVQDDAMHARVVETVVGTVAGRQEKALFELTSSGLGTHPFFINPRATLGHPATQKTVPASALQPGDRVRIWVDAQRQVIWGEITDKTDFTATGVYLGVNRSYTYLSGLRRYGVRSDLIVTGLAVGEYPEPGSTVRVAGTGNVISYMEVLSDRRPERHFKGTVLSTDGALSVRGNWTYEEVLYDKNTWFVDWELMEDGAVSSLFPGDVVTVHVDIADEVVLVERTYSPPFKLAGTIEARQGRTLIIRDKTGKKTVELTSTVRIYIDRVRGTLYDLRVGDTVSVSGTDKNKVDTVVCH